MYAGSLLTALRDLLAWHAPTVGVPAYPPGQWKDIQQFATNLAEKLESSSFTLHTDALTTAGAAIIRALLRGADSLDERALRGRKRTLAQIKKRASSVLAGTSHLFEPSSLDDWGSPALVDTSRSF